GSRNSCGSLRPVFLVTLKNLEEKKDYVFGLVHLKAGGNQRAFSQRWEQYERLGRLAQKYENSNLILLGDFNTTGYNIQDEDFVRFNECMNDASLQTTSRNIGCTNYWSGTSGRGEFISSILDHIVLQDKNIPRVKEVS